MIEQITSYINQNWVAWAFALFASIFSFLYAKLSKRIKAEQKKNDAIANGVQCLLRESIISNYNKYQERGYCPIYAKESLKRAYASYHGLEGNDVATQLYNTLLEMPEEPPKE